MSYNLVCTFGTCLQEPRTECFIYRLLKSVFLELLLAHGHGRPYGLKLSVECVGIVSPCKWLWRDNHVPLLHNLHLFIKGDGNSFLCRQYKFNTGSSGGKSEQTMTSWCATVLCLFIFTCKRHMGAQGHPQLINAATRILRSAQLMDTMGQCHILHTVGHSCSATDLNVQLHREPTFTPDCMQYQYQASSFLLAKTPPVHTLCAVVSICTPGSNCQAPYPTLCMHSCSFGLCFVSLTDTPPAMLCNVFLRLYIAACRSHCGSAVSKALPRG